MCLVLVKSKYRTVRLVSSNNVMDLSFVFEKLVSSLVFRVRSFHFTRHYSCWPPNNEKINKNELIIVSFPWSWKRESTFAADRRNSLGRFVRRQLRVGIAVIFATRRMQLKAEVALTYHRVCKFLIPKVFDCNSGPKKTVYVPITSPFDKVMSSRASRSIS